MRKRLAKYQFHLIALGLLLITAAAYHGVLRCGFTSYDDDGYVTENPLVKAGLSLSGIKWAFTTFDQSNWHPLTWLSYMLDKELYGLNPLGFHLTNLLLHLVNVLLLLIVFSRMTGSLWKSAFVAGLFAVHPLHVESVAWIAERKDVLSTFFWLSAMWAYVSYARKPGASRYALVIALFALGLMSKPMLVTFPFALLLLDYWPLGRLKSGRTNLQWKTYQALVVEKVPLFALAVCSSIITCLAQNQGQAVSTLGRVPLDYRLSNALVSYVGYLSKTFWPTKLAAFYPLARPPVGQVLGAVLALALVSYLVFRSRRDYLTVGWLWFVGTMVPVIGLVQVGAQAMADRYTYIPLIGLFIAAAWSIPSFGMETKRGGDGAIGRWGEIAGRAAACLVIGVLAVGTWVQVGYWRDDVTLFSHAIKVTKNNYVAYSILGSAMAKQGKYEEAVSNLRRGIELRSDMPLYYLSLGNSYFALGKYDEAVRWYARGLKVDPNMEDAKTNMEVARRRARFSGPGIHLPPKEAAEHYRKGTSFSDQGDLASAINEYKEAIRIDPRFAEAHCDLGLALSNLNRTDEAIVEYRKALSLRPDLAEAHNDLAVALYYKRQYREAWKEVYLCRKHGGTPIPDFVNALAQEMPDPGS